MWTDEATNAFVKLKSVMTSTPVLALPDFTKTFIIESDACGVGIGAVLMQEGRPIAFTSKPLGPRHMGLSTYEKELLAVVHAVTKWRPYLIGRRFLIRADQQSLKYFLDARAVTPAQQKWLTKLLGYDYAIEYKKGSSNKVADALSRKFENGEICSVTYVSCAWMEDLLAELKTDPWITDFIFKVSQPSFGKNNFTVRDGLVYYKQHQLVISPTSRWKALLLAEFHDSPIAGHAGYLKTVKRLSKLFYWSRMHKEVRDYIACCDVCQRNKYSTLSPAGYLQPLPIPTTVWTDISMDFVEGLPKSKGKTVILVVVDRLTKYAHFLALKHPYTATSVAQKFLETVIKLHGFPQSIVSDRDAVFTSNFWQELFRLHGTQLRMSSSYHPQTDGQTEVVNRCLEGYLRCFAGNKPKGWSSWLPWAEYWYNTSYHTSTNTTPFEALYGIPPPVLATYLPGEAKTTTLDEAITKRNEVLSMLKDQLQVVQNKMKLRADEGRRDVVYQVGDYVYLKLQPYRQNSNVQRKNQKLSPRYFGPYKILEPIGPVAYRLDLPKESKIHSVFHVSFLKKALFPNTAVGDNLPEEEDEVDPVISMVELILEVKENLKGEGMIRNPQLLRILN